MRRWRSRCGTRRTHRSRTRRRAARLRPLALNTVGALRCGRPRPRRRTPENSRTGRAAVRVINEKSATYQNKVTRRCQPPHTLRQADTTRPAERTGHQFRTGACRWESRARVPMARVLHDRAGSWPARPEWPSREQVGGNPDWSQRPILPRLELTGARSAGERGDYLGVIAEATAPAERVLFEAWLADAFSPRQGRLTEHRNGGGTARRAAERAYGAAKRVAKGSSLHHYDPQGAEIEAGRWRALRVVRVQRQAGWRARRAGDGRSGGLLQGTAAGLATRRWASEQSATVRHGRN